MLAYTKISCDCRNPQRLLNKLTEKNIAVRKVEINDDIMRFSIDDKQLKSVKKIMDKMAISHNVESRSGSYLAKKLTLRYISIVLTAIVMITLLFCLTTICFDVRIDCDDPQLKGQIADILNSNSIKAFTPKSKIDTSKLSYELTKSIDKIGFANCYFNGGVLHISIKEVHVKEEEPEYDTIVADRDCIITKVLVYSGTALVKEGDVVKKGDVLIEGYVDSMPNDPQNEENERFYVKADGVVMGETAYTKQIVMTDSAITAVRTGESYSVTQIYLFGKLIGKQNPIKYESYEYTTQVKTFGSVIPIKAVTTTYYETKLESTPVEEADIEEAISLAYIELWHMLPNDAKLLNDYTYKKKLDNLHIIDIYLITEEEISAGK